MSASNQESKKRGRPTLTEAVLVAIAFAVLVTVCGWFIAGKASPINHGVEPDVHCRPLLGLWVVANFPAAILFISLFSKLGSETQYFFCVFLQWLALGTPLGLIVASMRRAAKTHE